MSDLKLNIDDMLNNEFAKQKIDKKLEDLNTPNADCKCKEHEMKDVLTDVNELREDVHENKKILQTLDQKFDILLKAAFESNNDNVKVVDDYVQEKKEEDDYNTKLNKQLPKVFEKDYITDKKVVVALVREHKEMVEKKNKDFSAVKNKRDDLFIELAIEAGYFPELKKIRSEYINFKNNMVYEFGADNNELHSYESRVVDLTKKAHDDSIPEYEIIYNYCLSAYPYHFTDISDIKIKMQAENIKMNK